MKKSVLIGTISILALVALTAAVGLQDDVVKFDTKLGTVTFPHKAHIDMGTTCKTCHHTLAEDTGTPDQKCTECHTADSDVKTKDAFHKACITCHKEQESGPTKCKECHVR